MLYYITNTHKIFNNINRFFALPFILNFVVIRSIIFINELLFDLNVIILLFIYFCFITLIFNIYETSIINYWGNLFEKSYKNKAFMELLAHFLGVRYSIRCGQKHYYLIVCINFCILISSLFIHSQLSPTAFGPFIAGCLFYFSAFILMIWLMWSSYTKGFVQNIEIPSNIKLKTDHYTGIEKEYTQEEMHALTNFLMKGLKNLHNKERNLPYNIEKQFFGSGKVKVTIAEAISNTIKYSFTNAEIKAGTKGAAAFAVFSAVSGGAVYTHLEKSRINLEKARIDLETTIERARIDSENARIDIEKRQAEIDNLIKLSKSDLEYKSKGIETPEFIVKGLEGESIVKTEPITQMKPSGYTDSVKVTKEINPSSILEKKNYIIELLNYIF